MASPEFTPEYAKQLFGDPAELSERLRRFRQDAIFFDEHREELKKQYPDQYVAIKGEQVVASSPLIDDILPQIQEKGLPTEDLYIRFLPTQEIPLILAAA